MDLVRLASGSRERPPTGDASVGGLRDARPAVSTIRLEPRVEDLRRPARLAPGPIGWLVPSIALLAIAAGIYLVRQPPQHLTHCVMGAILLGGMGWVLVSSLAWDTPERTCPQCGAEGLERLSLDSTCGIRCSACNWQDETESSFFFAEEGVEPIEDIVLRERHRSGAGRPHRRAR